VLVVYASGMETSTATSDDRKEVCILVRVSRRQRDEIRRAARRLGMGSSTLMRELVMELIEGATGAKED